MLNNTKQPKRMENYGRITTKYADGKSVEVAITIPLCAVWELKALHYQTIKM
jgi:hypothetical protein